MNPIQTLSLSLKAKGEEGEPLPTVFPQLEALGVHLRRGWLHLIGAAPGGGKSAFASFYALNADYTGAGDRVPTLYFSADNDTLTFGKAALAPALGVHTIEAERLIEEGDRQAFASLDEATDHMWVSFDASPSNRDISQEMDAFATVYGEWPHLVIIDNLMDVDFDDGESKATSYDAILAGLRQKARETSAAIVVLCHVVGGVSGSEPIAAGDLMYKIDRKAQLVLTLFSDSDNVLCVSSCKNRGAKANRDGTLYTRIPWLPALGWFGTEG